MNSHSNSLSTVSDTKPTEAGKGCGLEYIKIGLLVRYWKSAFSILGTKHSWPSGSSEVATSDDPKALASAIRFGNRATRRLAAKRLAASHRKLMNQIGGDL